MLERSLENILADYHSLVSLLKIHEKPESSFFSGPNAPQSRDCDSCVVCGSRHKMIIPSFLAD